MRSFAQAYWPRRSAPAFLVREQRTTPKLGRYDFFRRRTQPELCFQFLAAGRRAGGLVGSSVGTKGGRKGSRDKSHIRGRAPGAPLARSWRARSAYGRSRRCPELWLLIAAVRIVIVVPESRTGDIWGGSSNLFERDREATRRPGRLGYFSRKYLMSATSGGWRWGLRRPKSRPARPNALS